MKLAHFNLYTGVDYSLDSFLMMFLGILVTESGLKSMLLKSSPSISELALLPGFLLGGVKFVEERTSSCKTGSSTSSKLIYW